MRKNEMEWAVFFLWIPENHILEDVNKCVIALQEGDVDTLDRTAGAIRGRAARVIHIINAEMENYETGVYTEKVLEATKLLSETGEFVGLLKELLKHSCFSWFSEICNSGGNLFLKTRYKQINSWPRVCFLFSTQCCCRSHTDMSRIREEIQ